MSTLYEIVVQYSDLGDHRTGTAVDAATVDWVTGLLADRGADVARQPFVFSKFTGRARGSGGAQGVHLEPLYYSATGAHSDDAAFVASIDFDDDHSDRAITNKIAEVIQQTLVANAAVAVLATKTTSGGLCAINRAPAPPPGRCRSVWRLAGR